MRDQYSDPHENESVRKFVAEEPDDLEWSNTWLQIVRDGRAQGRTFCRVRVVSVPLTDHSRFGLWASRFTVEAGEDIRYINRANATDLPDHDYWLFDSHQVVRLNFDDNSVFLGAEFVEDSASIVQHNWWRDAARHQAVRREHFAAE